MLTVNTLNSEHIRWHNDEIQPLRTRKTRALLFFLLIEWTYYKRYQHRREFLADLLWPASKRQLALNNLRQSLHIINETCTKVGIPNLFFTNRQTVQKSEGVSMWCDLQALQNHNSTIGLLRLPHNPLKPLPNMVIYGAYPFQDWLEALEADVETQAYQAFLKAIDREIESQNWSYCESLIESHFSRVPSSPDLLEKIAIACAHQGKTAQANQWFEQAGIKPEYWAPKIRTVQYSPVATSGDGAYVPNPKALELYLLGWSTYKRATPETTNQAVAHFEEAIRVDPGFKRAYLGLATAISTQGSWWGDKKMKDVLPSFEAAIKNIAEEPDLQAEINAVLGFTKLWLWKIGAAEYHFRKSINAGSSTSYGRLGLSLVLNIMGKYQEARKNAQTAIYEDPYSIQSYITMADSEILMKNFERAEEICRLALTRQPDYQVGISTWVKALNYLGEYAQAIDLSEKNMSRTGRRPAFILGRLAVAYYQRQQKQYAQEILKEMEQRAQANEKGFPYFIALYYQTTGHSKKALEWLEAYFPEQPKDYIWINTQPEFYSLYDDERFMKIISQVYSRLLDQKQ